LRLNGAGQQIEGHEGNRYVKDRPETVLPNRRTISEKVRVTCSMLTMVYIGAALAEGRQKSPTTPNTK
jgi:hypothetical protein